VSWEESEDRARLENGLTVELGISLALHSGENAKLTHNQHVDVHGLLVARKANVAIVAVGACAVAFDVKDDVLFMLEPACVDDSDYEFSGIKMHGHLLGFVGTPNPEIAHHGFLAGQSLFLRDGIPLVALLENQLLHALPNKERALDRQRIVELIFVALLFFGKLGGQIFLRGLLGVLIRHGPVSRLNT